VLLAISHAHLVELHSHVPQLLDWSVCLSTLPLDCATHVLVALLPLVPLHAGFARHLLLLLRKMLVSPEPRGRKLAVHGFSALLCASLLPEPAAQQDAVLALRAAAAAASPALQPHVFASLRGVVAARARVAPAAFALLLDSLLLQVR